MMSQGHLNSCWPAAWRVLQATCKQISYRAKGNKKEEKVDPFTSPPPPLSFFLVCFSPTSFERYAKQWSKRVCTKHLISVESTLLQKRWLHYGGRRRRRRKGEGEEEEEGGAHNTVAASSRIKNTAGSFPMQRSQSAEEVKCIRPVDVFTPPPSDSRLGTNISRYLQTTCSSNRATRPSICPKRGGVKPSSALRAERCVRKHRRHTRLPSHTHFDVQQEFPLLKINCCTKCDGL